MLDKRLWITAAALALTAMTAVVATSFLEEEAALSQQNVQDIPRTSTERGGADPVSREGRREEPTPDYMYIIREHGGRIGVFLHGEDEPESILNVLVRNLPQYDQDKLRAGVKVQSYGELLLLLEDYNS